MEMTQLDASTQRASQKLHAVIRFKRAVTFPRFSMAEGERWGFVVFGSSVEKLRAIKEGDRFEFAGGQCLSADVELIYEGPGNRAYSLAAGYIRARNMLPDEKRLAYVEHVRCSKELTKLVLATYAASHQREEGESDHDYLSRCAEQDYEDGPDGCCSPSLYMSLQ